MAIPLHHPPGSPEKAPVLLTRWRAVGTDTSMLPHNGAYPATSHQP